MELAPGGQEMPVNPTVVLRDRQVSAVATAVTVVYDIRGIDWVVCGGESAWDGKVQWLA